MATKKNNAYLDMELEWLEARAEELKKFVESNPIDQLTDRITEKKVVATIEVQIDCLRDTLQDYIKIVEGINRLKSTAEDNPKLPGKRAIRGDQSLSPIEEDFS